MRIKIAAIIIAKTVKWESKNSRVSFTVPLIEGSNEQPWNVIEEGAVVNKRDAVIKVIANSKFVVKDAVVISNIGIKEVRG